MSNSNQVKAVLAGVLCLVGVMLAVQPRNWIEERFGFEPDAGSGMLELALVVLPIAFGLALATSVYVAHRVRHRERRSGKSVLDAN